MCERPQVSVIILNYNKPGYTFKCVESILRFTRSVSFEIIVVDNGSTIGDIEKITELSPKVRLLKSSINLGFSKGNNLGISHCKGETILLLNNDTVLINDAISITFKKLAGSLKLGVVGAQLLYPNNQIQESANNLPELKYLLVELFRLQKIIPRRRAGKLLLGSFFDHQEEIICGWLWGTYFHFKREILNKLSAAKLPDDFFMYNEDLQWGIEINRLGYKFLFCPIAKVYHYEGVNNFKSSMADSNFSYVMVKYYGKYYHFIYKSIRGIINLTNVFK
jgi:GT2 family glycosyltransferase